MSDREYYAMSLFNEIFGGSSVAKLFMNVREKQSLCYYCASHITAASGCMMVDSGVEPANAQKAEGAILAELNTLLDGPIARRTGTAGPSGARLDSITDAVFAAAAVFRLLPAVLPQLPGWTGAACIAIAAVRLAAYAVGAVKFRRLTALHTAANKATGLLLFAAPLLLPFADLRLLAAGLCGLAAVSAAEELACVLKMQAYDPDTLSIFRL